MVTSFNFEVFDKRNGRLTKTPELTIQGKGAMSMNAAAAALLKDAQAVELLYDRDANVIGIRGVPGETTHAYPIRPIGKGGTHVISARAFFAFYGIPLGTPVRRDVSAQDGVIIVNLNDPGRVVISNRNRAKATAEARSDDGASLSPGPSGGG